MAMGILETVRAAGLGQVHELVNRAAANPETLAQLIRDLETARDELIRDIREQEGIVTTLNRHHTDAVTNQQHVQGVLTGLVTNAESATTDADKARYNGLAEQLGPQLDQLNSQESTTNTALLTAKKRLSDLQDGLRAVTAKHDAAMAQLHELQEMDLSTHAETHATAAMDRIGHVLSQGGEVDDLVERMRQRYDQANAGFEDALGASTAVSPLQEAEAALSTSSGGSALEQIRAKVRAQQAQAAPASS